MLQDKEELTQKAVDADNRAEALLEENVTLARQLADTKLQVCQLTQ